ncbi:MAG: histidine kinase dimerization/phospho-acceptor domain-containing protein, partial [Cyclobacteriaceae bacterium]
MNTPDQTYVSPEDIISCENEQIHLIGSIQQHGYLIAFNQDSKKVEYASSNTPELFNGFDPLGQLINDLDKHFNSYEGKNILAEYYNLNTLGDKATNSYKVVINEKQYVIISYFVGERFVMEFEPSESNNVNMKTQSILGEIMIKMSPQNQSLEDLLQMVSDEIKGLLGYDRVMIYKFWEDGHGEVVAESKNEDLQTFKGLHYPATDIPSQARELYKRKITRLLVDVSADPVPVRSHNTEILDLSDSNLRSVSPIHLEYLENMNVAATFTISLLFKGELWGMISCHHSEPRFIDFEKRKASEVISHYLFNLLELKQSADDSGKILKVENYLKDLDQQVRDDWHLENGLMNHTTTFLDLCNCIGGAISHGDKIVTLGQTPTEQQIAKIIDWLAENKSNNKVFNTTNLAGFIPVASEFSDIASGLMAVTLSRELKEYILWFKPEQIVEVNWAGKDDKGLVQREDGKYRMSPRKSFEKWTEEVRETSIGWQEIELKAALELQQNLTSFIRLKINEITRLNEKLRVAYQDLDAFSYTLSHDLKTPLNTILGYLELYIEENDIDESDPLLEKIFNNTKLMSEMISNILSYSKLGRDEINKENVEVLPILQEIKSQMLATHKFENINIQNI